MKLRGIETNLLHVTNIVSNNDTTEQKVLYDHGGKEQTLVLSRNHCSQHWCVVNHTHPSEEVSLVKDVTYQKAILWAVGFAIGEIVSGNNADAQQFFHKGFAEGSKYGHNN